MAIFEPSTPVKLQLSHIGLSLVWNVVGIFLMSQGKQALGPTANWAVIAVLAGLALLLVYGYKRARWLYVLTTIVLVYGATNAILPAFLSDNPDLWPHVFWRVAGVAVNMIGIVGAVWGLNRNWRATTVH